MLLAQRAPLDRGTLNLRAPSIKSSIVTADKLFKADATVLKLEKSTLKLSRYNLWYTLP